MSAVARREQPGPGQGRECAMPPTMNKLRLTPEQFDQVAERMPRMSAATLEMTRRALVDGETHVEIAADCGVTRQAVQAAVTRVSEAFAKVPAGWQRVDVWLPPAMAAQVRQMAAQAEANRRAGAAVAQKAGEGDDD